MKKTLSLVLALTLAFALCLPAFAATPPEPKSVNVTYDVAALYNITIPESVTIADEGTTMTVEVLAGSRIPARNSLTISITGAAHYDSTESAFRMANNAKTDILLGYTITNGATAVTRNNAFLTATPAQVNEGTSVTLTFAAATAVVAGTYSDTLTFAVTLEPDAPI